MPRELNPLPCPACGAHPELGGSQDGTELWIACGNLRKCRMAGPTRTTIAEAVDAWNALPRALTWTDEPPKVPGWYWWRNLSKPQVVHSNNFKNRKPHPADEWAGPIPEPREPK